MQISENLLRVIFMLSTIVAVTDCCSSRLLLLKEHTLQVVQHRLHKIEIGDESAYGYDDYDQLQQQQQQQQQLEQQQQQQKMPQYVGITNSDIELNKNSTDEHTRSRDDNEENSTDTEILIGSMQLHDFGMDSFESLLGIFDAAAFITTTTTTVTKTEMKETTTEMIETTTEMRETTTEMREMTAESLSSTTKGTTTVEATTKATTTTTPTTIKIDKESSTPQTAESSTQKASTVGLNEINAGDSTQTKTPIFPTIISEMQNVMNDLKTAGDLLSLPCSGQFNTEFCLNRGRCFRYPIGNDTIHSCICADGYIGERCESKSMNGSFIPSIAGAHKKKIAMARIVFSFPMLVALSVIYIIIGASIVFKRPPTIPESETSSSRSTLSLRERCQLFSEEDAVGEFIAMNSYHSAI